MLVDIYCHSVKKSNHEYRINNIECRSEFNDFNIPCSVFDVHYFF